MTGGSDGSVRVWSLSKFVPIHRLAAHDNSVTSLQFDDTRVVSGGSDGRVKVWDLKTGHLVRELIAQGEAVWRVAFEEEKCVAMALRNGRTVMEVSSLSLILLGECNSDHFQVWSFSPPEEMLYDRPISLAQGSTEVSDHASDTLSLDFRRSQIRLPGISRLDAESQDVDMRDVGPSTAPLQSSNATFFHDD